MATLVTRTLRSFLLVSSLSEMYVGAVLTRVHPCLLAPWFLNSTQMCFGHNFDNGETITALISSPPGMRSGAFP